MTKTAAALVLCAVSASRAAVVESVPRLGPAMPAAWSGAVLSAPSLSPMAAAPALSVAPVAAPLASMPRAAAAPASAPAASPAAEPARAAALRALPAPNAGPADSKSAAGESAATEASRVWDGFRGARPSDDAALTPEPPVDGLPPALSEGWDRGSFESADGLTVAYKRREGPAGAAPRVYSGGLALNESFDPLFAKPGAPARSEYFLWTRGHPPTGWTPTEAPIDGDARDLARMIVLAARESGAKKVELALHSFGTLVFQRLLQLREEPEVAAALNLLSGSRVFMLNATTHYEGSEKRAGRDFEAMGTATKQFVDWLNAMDSVAAAWKRAADFNPFFRDPFTQTMLYLWGHQREQVLGMASKGAADMMRADLKAPWAPEIDAIRRAFLAALARDSQDPGWQESLLRRSSDMFRLEASAADVKVLHEKDIRLELIHSAGDMLLNWASAQTLFELLGIRAPKKTPAPGTTLTDDTGRFRAHIVDGDHYWPLKRRDELAARLEP